MGALRARKQTQEVEGRWMGLLRSEDEAQSRTTSKDRNVCEAAAKGCPALTCLLHPRGWGEPSAGTSGSLLALPLQVKWRGSKS